MLGKASAVIDKAALSPVRIPDDAVKIIAVTPAVLFGVAIFRLQAVEFLALALAAGLLAHLAARIAGWKGANPVAAALISVVVVGPAAPILLVAACALGTVILELLRARFLSKASIQIGLLIYVVVLLASRGAIASYTDPFGGSAHVEPIRFWHQFFPADAAPIDPVRLYVGNLAGPVFATSLLMAVIGAAVFWYTRRMSPVVLAGFLIGALVPIYFFHWNAVFQLDSGPAWLVASLVLADRSTLPGGLTRPFIGIAAGLSGFAVRHQGAGIEGVFVAIAATQLFVAAIEGAVWLQRNRSDLGSAFHLATQTHLSRADS
ncbi:MAG TPA: RnfABCDGE type electron transport complex subunit D [Candidatus Dormibacteraeota bacterium]|nr:RnfABCDGE type electron transport complex subunit D [Candidatus Dormibacteraeota bacterium]